MDWAILGTYVLPYLTNIVAIIPDTIPHNSHSQTIRESGLSKGKQR